MRIPIVQAAPIVQRHAAAFGDIFIDRRQYEHFEQYITGLMVLDSKLSRSRFGSIPPSPAPSPARREGADAPGKPLPLYGGGVWGGGSGQNRDLLKLISSDAMPDGYFYRIGAMREHVMILGWLRRRLSQTGL